MLLCPPYHPHNLLLLLAFLCVSKGQDVSPILIETCATESLQVSVTVPEAPTLQPVDVLFLFDDTGTFELVASQLANQFATLVASLLEAFPTIDFGYGVGKFEDFGGPGSDYGGISQTSRPAILNQPIVTTAQLDGDEAAFIALLTDALRRIAPDNGGDLPESAIEGLYQMVVGSGFDGNGDGSFNGLNGTQTAGALASQISPDASGDVPAINSLDPTVLSAGTVGGARFRTGSKRLIILATDICTVAPFSGEIPATISSEFSSEPSTEFSCAGGVRYGQAGNALIKAESTIEQSIAPLGAHTVPETVAALVANGIQVMGLAVNGGPQPSGSGPSDNEAVYLSALARLTGAVDGNGDPLVSQINIDDPSGIQAAILNAISQFVDTRVNVEISPQGCDTIEGLTITFDTAVGENISPGETVTFDVSFNVDPEISAGTCEFQFVDGDGNQLTDDVIQVEICQDTEAPSTGLSSGPSVAITSDEPSVAPAIGSISDSPSAAPSPVLANSDVPSQAPSLEGTTSAPTVSIAPTALAKTRPPAMMSSKSLKLYNLFSRVTGKGTFKRINVKGRSKTGVRYDFTVPGKGSKGNDGDCWGFDCDNNGRRRGKGGKGSKGVKGSKRGKGGSKGAKDVGIFDLIFAHDDTSEFVRPGGSKGQRFRSKTGGTNSGLIENPDVESLVLMPNSGDENGDIVLQGTILIRGGYNG